MPSIRVGNVAPDPIPRGRSKFDVFESRDLMKQHQRPWPSMADSQESLRRNTGALLERSTSSEAFGTLLGNDFPKAIGEQAEGRRSINNQAPSRRSRKTLNAFRSRSGRTTRLPFALF